MIEIWKDVIGYEGFYQISNYGNFKSLDRTIKVKHFYKKIKGKILKPYLTTRGYLHIDLCDKSWVCHILVASHFLDNPNNLKYINHIDGDKTNNFTPNLEYVSQQENICHYFKNKNTTSNLTGVGFNKNANKWKSRIHFENKSIHLGYFNTEQEAYNARCAFEKENNIINKYL